MYTTQFYFQLALLPSVTQFQTPWNLNNLVGALIMLETMVELMRIEEIHYPQFTIIWGRRSRLDYPLTWWISIDAEQKNTLRTENRDGYSTMEKLTMIGIWNINSLTKEGASDN